MNFKFCTYFHLTWCKNTLWDFLKKLVSSAVITYALWSGVYISIKNQNYSGMPQKIFKTFPKFRIFFLWIFSPKVFQDCFLSYCIKSFPKLRKKFPQISRIYQNFFYQTSKLFRKNTEIPKLFQYDYMRINRNIHPCKEKIKS